MGVNPYYKMVSLIEPSFLVTFSRVDWDSSSVELLLILPILIPFQGLASKAGQKHDQGTNSHHFSHGEASSPLQEDFLQDFGHAFAQEQTKSNRWNVQNSFGNDKAHVKEQIGCRQKRQDHY